MLALLLDLHSPIAQDWGMKLPLHVTKDSPREQKRCRKGQAEEGREGALGRLWFGNRKVTCYHGAEDKMKKLQWEDSVPWVNSGTLRTLGDRRDSGKLKPWIQPSFLEPQCQEASVGPAGTSLPAEIANTSSWAQTYLPQAWHRPSLVVPEASVPSLC